MSDFQPGNEPIVYVIGVIVALALLACCFLGYVR